jgi:hypothetical protein
MRGGEPHDLDPTVEQQHDGRAVKYRCKKCGEGYQVRTTAPSCRVRFLEQMKQLLEPQASMEPAPRRSMLEELVRRRLTWPRPFRDAMLEQFERWHAWKVVRALDRPDD